ncbi:Sec-independent protein translocase protein TatB [Litorimonas cladophorae]|nr:Sec-independent protein translocase protein TatB [Litorimonas cladophorae]
MLPSIGFPEMMVIVLLAIIFVGPKDLPALMRTVGQWIARIRAMGNEFKSAFDDMGMDAEVASIRREIEEMKNLGKLDPELDGEMKALNAELREATDLSSPHKPAPSKPKSETDGAQSPEDTSSDD